MELNIFNLFKSACQSGFFKSNKAGKENAVDMFCTVNLLPSHQFNSITSWNFKKVQHQLSDTQSMWFQSPSNFLIYAFFFSVCVCVVWWQHLLLQISGCPSVTMLTYWRVTSVWRCTMSGGTRPSSSAATTAFARRAWHISRPKLMTTLSVLHAELIRV